METVDKLQFYFISHQAFEKYGKEKQMRQLQEECAELIAAINHHFRGRDNNLDETIEEIADVTLMLSQIVEGLNLHEKLNHITNIKLKKIQSKLDDTWQLTK